MKKASVLLLLVLILIPFGAFSQTLSTKNKKAIKFYEQAINEYTLGHTMQAELQLINALNVDAHFIEPYFIIGDIKAEEGYIQDAIEFYEKGIAIQSDYYPKAYFLLGQLQLKLGLYEEALQNLDAFLKFPNSSETDLNDALFLRKNCLFALEAILHPVPFHPENLGPAINSMYSEYFPSLTVDNSFMLFTRQLPQQFKDDQEDFYGAIRLNDSTWNRYFALNDINTPVNEGAACISADGKTMIFTACESIGDYGSGRQGYGSCDLFFTRKKGNRWQAAQNMGKPINSANWESQPSLSSDGKSLYFVRAPKRAGGSADIYRADLDEDGYWQTPVKLGPTINTDKDEQSVFIHPDNQTLYFSSNGHPGMGGSDLYFSRWDEEKQDWGEAENMGYPINTFKDENSILISPDGQTAYFASDRDEGFGKLDLYQFPLPVQDQPQKISYLKGIVFDKETQDPLSARFELIDLKSTKQLQLAVTDATDGSFLLTLYPDKDYLLNVSRPGYLFYSDQFMLTEANGADKPFLKNIPLQPIAVGEKVILRNIFFDTDQSSLKPESTIELEKLIQFLNNNPSVKIEIQGHTDNVGTKAYNQNLSTQRAKAVYDYLIFHQINADRLTYRGYGFDVPLNDNQTESGRANNRRTEFEITQL